MSNYNEKITQFKLPKYSCIKVNYSTNIYLDIQGDSFIKQNSLFQKI